MDPQTPLSKQRSPPRRYLPVLSLHAFFGEGVVNNGCLKGPLYDTNLGHKQKGREAGDSDNGPKH